MKARRAGLELFYDNVDITADLRQHLLGFQYVDNMSGQSDDIQVTLEDRQRLWIGDWFPDKGATLKAAIVQENWSGDNQNDRLDIGVFEIDEPGISGPPLTVTIKGLSVPEGSASLREQDKNKAWEETTLSGIAGSIAGDNGMSLFFDSSYDPPYDRKEQTEQSDLVFLQKLCSDAGLSLKIAEKKIIIFEDSKYEAAAPITTIEYGLSSIISYSGNTKSTGIYSSCAVEYTDAKTKETYSYTFTPPNPPKTGKTLHINERVTSVAGALELAKRKLRQENCTETEFNVTLVGNVRYLAALTVIIKSFGVFDGKYIITQATHKGSKYEVSLRLRRCLEGY